MFENLNAATSCLWDMVFCYSKF